MYLKNSKGEVVKVSDTILLKLDEQTKQELVEDLQSVDTAALKQTIYEWEHGYKIFLNSKLGRDEALVQIASIKKDIPDFDDSPLDPAEHKEVIVLLNNVAEKMEV